MRSTAIELSKRQPFSRVLFGLNIPDVGWVTARNLARHFGTVDRLLDASQEEIQEVEGIGPDRAEAIAEWFSDEQNRALVAELRELGLRFEVGEEERPVEGPLTGSQYVITGTLEAYSREEAKAALEALGAKVSDNVSKKTTGVVVGESPGSKVAKAEKAGVPLLVRSGPASSSAPSLERCREHGREPVLRHPRPAGRDRAAVLEDREDVAVADEAGKRRRESRRAGLRDHPAARGSALQPVLERPVDARRRRASRGTRPAGRRLRARPRAARRARVAVSRSSRESPTRPRSGRR